MASGRPRRGGDGVMDWSRQAEAGWVYALVTFAGLGLGAWFWSRRVRETPSAFAVFVGAVVGAYAGAKLLFVLVEGWAFLGEPGGWMKLAAGKTILGALLGGYAGVEVAKRLVGHREPTGDWFAVGGPLAIAAGRLGCLRYGCCLGVPVDAASPWALVARDGVARWPAVPVELAFNLLFVAAILPMVRWKGSPRAWWRGQCFHLYLIAYGLFRFGHEFLRDTPKSAWGIGGYQVAALALVALGAIRGWQRGRSRGKG
ncbi:MAG TPA: prolipoprotein diacylglyceryl transferase [Bacteroidia bacterium]|nr:prolipoprotein diacylglyceryl transferase [Bacteroidia bacterium]